METEQKTIANYLHGSVLRGNVLARYSHMLYIRALKRPLSYVCAQMERALMSCNRNREESNKGRNWYILKRKALLRNPQKRFRRCENASECVKCQKTHVQFCGTFKASELERVSKTLFWEATFKVRYCNKWFRRKPEPLNRRFIQNCKGFAVCLRNHSLPYQTLKVDPQKNVWMVCPISDPLKFYGIEELFFGISSHLHVIWNLWNCLYWFLQGTYFFLECEISFPLI